MLGEILRKLIERIRRRVFTVVFFMYFMIVCMSFFDSNFGVLHSTTPFFIYNHTASCPVGWYFVVPDWFSKYVKNNNLQYGDLVCFDLPEEMHELAIERQYIGVNDLVLKKVAGLSGDTYEVKVNEKGIEEFYINNVFYGEIPAFDKKNRLLPRRVLNGKYMVAEHSFLAMSDHYASFDSRFYGALDFSCIRYRVIPVPFLTKL